MRDMRIGLLSDTHGNISRTRAAIGLLKTHGVEVVIHCGDVGSEAVLDELSAGLSLQGIPVHVVLGNVDPWEEGISGYSRPGGPTLLGDAGHLRLGGREIAVLHGHEERRLRATIEGGKFDFVFTGHTHIASDERVGRTRVINPGAVHRARVPSVAILDTSTDAVMFIPLSDATVA